MKSFSLFAIIAALGACGLSVAAIAAPPPVPLPSALNGVPVYLAVDSGSGQILAARQHRLSFVPASLTKVMTAYVAFELLTKGRLRADQRMIVSPATAARWNGRGTSMYLRAGESVSVDDLLHGITTVSANDACIVLAEGAAGSVASWVGLMNAKRQELGLTGSQFGTPNGWPDQGQTYVSAADLVTLGQALINRHPDLYRRYFGHQTMVWNGVTQRNHDPTVGIVRGADGIKTGHTAEAGFGFLGSAIRDGHRVMIVVAGAHSEVERTQASRALMEWSFAAWDRKPLFADQQTIGLARVQNGTARQVALVAARAVSVAVPRGTHPEIRLTIHYRGPLVAPIARGATVAELEIAVTGQPASRIPLQAAQAVGLAGMFDRLANGLAGLLP